MAFSPEDITTEIQRHIPDFTIEYQPDFRQSIAESWSQSIDDQPAREDWDWLPDYDLSKMTSDMITNIKKIYF
jgi:hypothetical protein